VTHLRPILALFLAEGRGMLRIGALLAAVTALAGIALLSLSGWFITATAIAGLSIGTALVFDVFQPSAGIRLLTLARTAARYGERVTTHDATLRILAGLRERLFRGWAAPGAARRLLARPARLLFRLTVDVDALDALYLRVLIPAGVALVAALAAGLALGLLQPLLGLGVLALLGCAGFGLPALAARRAQAPVRRRAHAVEALRARSIDLVSGQTELAMAGRLAAQHAAVMAADRRMAVADDALNRIEARLGAGFGAMAAILLAGTLLGVAALAERGVIGAPAAAFGLLVAFAAVEPFAALRRGALELGRSLLAARRLGPRLAPPPPPDRPAAPPPGLALRLDAVTLRHDGAHRPALHSLDLAVAIGERVALLGPSGAGKTSLLTLLAGEQAAEAGRAEALPATLLTQRTELFRDDLRGNLLLADPAADDGRLRAALADAGLAANLDAMLGEDGLGLSGGQARRLALARLLLRDTPLWLLDEPTEGLDAATARDVLRRLLDRAAGRTLLIATHIRREAEIADRLLLIGHGNIIAAARRGEPVFASLLATLRPD
jgi:ATP-binding cassette subfamily C protein CydC